MPREIRTLKRSLFTDEKLATVSRGARLTFVGLIPHADDYGRLKGDPRLIKAAIYPLDEGLSAADVAAEIDELEAIGVVRRYTVSGTVYLELVNFEKHQVMSRKYASDIPAPPPVDQTEAKTVRAQVVRTADAVREHSRRGEEKERKGAERKGEESGTATAPLADARTSNGNGQGTAKHFDHATHRLEYADLPLDAQRFVEAFYPRGKVDNQRRRDVADQMLAALNGGAQLRRGVSVRAHSPDRLARKCREVIAEGVKRADTAIVVLLKKLADVTDLGPGGEGPGAALKASLERTAEQEESETDAAVRGWRRRNEQEAQRIEADVLAEYEAASIEELTPFQRMAAEARIRAEIVKAMREEEAHDAA